MRPRKFSTEKIIVKLREDSKMQKVTNNGDRSPLAPRVIKLSNSLLRQLKEIYKLKAFINVGETRIIG